MRRLLGSAGARQPLSWRVSALPVRRMGTTQAQSPTSPAAAGAAQTVPSASNPSRPNPPIDTTAGLPVETMRTTLADGSVVKMHTTEGPQHGTTSISMTQFGRNGVDLFTTTITASPLTSSNTVTQPPEKEATPATASSSKKKSNASKKRKHGADEKAAKGATTADMNSTAMCDSNPTPTRSIGDLAFAYTSFQDVTPLAAIKSEFAHIAPGEKCSDVVRRVGGRVISVRDMGRILFITISGYGEQFQVLRQVDANFDKKALKALKESIKTGDILGVEGHPGRTQKGELSLYASDVRVLTPYVCVDQDVCPDMKGFTRVDDVDLKYRYRFIDMMTNHERIAHIRRRHTIIRALRNFLDARDFTEVETPMLHSVASGANARPFVTHHNANDADLFLRVAPELHLKQCVVGGLERVYEVGRVFRNEGADRSHNPEFTSCEFYAAYHTYEDLMPLTEDILRDMARAVNGHTRVRLASTKADGESAEVDLAKPFRRVSVYDEIQRAADVELPPPTELNTARGLAYMSAIMLRYSIPLPSVRTAAKMFDKLIDFFITDHVVEPTFVMDHPLFMSPLAKAHADKPGLSERFELFIGGTEYCNAYSELNDPQEQFRRFQQQLVDRQTGDDEAMALDETFLKALQVGLPPTAGWGMGMDRVVMLLNGSASIRDDIIFPLLRDNVDSRDAKRRRKTAGFFGFNPNMTLFCINALEQELSQRHAPADSLEKVRQIRRFIQTLDKDDKVRLPNCEVSGFQFELTMAVLRMFCRPK